MTVLFERAASLQIGTLVLSDLHFSFKIEKSLKSSPNNAEVVVYNLREDHRGQIESSAAGVLLRAGYKHHETVIFLGDKRRVTSTYDQPDWITKIEGEDGGRSRRVRRVNRSFRPGTPIQTVFENLAHAMGVGVGNIADVVPYATFAGSDTTFPGGTSASGNAALELDRFCASANLSWSIQNGSLQLIHLGGTLQGQSYSLTKSSGLIGTPEKQDRGKITARALLIPDLVPGRLVQIESSSVRGTYRVDKSTFTGDTRGQDWYVDISCTSTEAIARTPLLQEARLQQARRLGQTIADDVIAQVARATGRTP